MPKHQDIVLSTALRCMAPLVRLLVRHGVTYPALAAALKRSFVDAATLEIELQGMKRTDSALTLLSGVHRKDVREMQSTNAPIPPSKPPSAPLSLVGQVVAQWLTAAAWTTAGQPNVLPRSGATHSFDALVRSVSQDIRPRAMLDEMLRLGVVRESAAGLALQQHGLVPHQGFDAMCEAMALNVHDHAAAAAANLDGDAKHLEQAVYVDEISAESAAHLHAVARQAWQDAFATVMAAAQARFDHDAMHTPQPLRNHRARFGVYFHDQANDASAPRKVRSTHPLPEA